MEIAITERFWHDSRGLSNTLANKCERLIAELKNTDDVDLRQKALPGWRLHALRNSNMLSLSLDMNFRVLAEMRSGTLLLHRVVKHDTADRADVNRNTSTDVLARWSSDALNPADVYAALLSFGVPEQEAVPFRDCSDEDELLEAAASASPRIGNLALTLYDTSGLVISKARFRVLHSDETFARLLEAGGIDWELYLHPSQAFIVDLPSSFRAAVVGSAGTGKTVCAWHRAKQLIRSGVPLGFVCTHQSVLSVSKDRLLRMGGSGEDKSYFFVPANADELIQLADAVEHLIVDEAQEIPVSWLSNLSKHLAQRVGVTFFYDINQLGGNIPNGDVGRYKRRIGDWKHMIGAFPSMQRFSLIINYRNAREIAEYYLTLLADALPVKPLADVPAFETGDVVLHQTKRDVLEDVVGSIVRRLLQEHPATDIGVVTLESSPKRLCDALRERKLPVCEQPSGSDVVVANASTIRGHERRVIVVVTKSAESMKRNFGVAIDAYIAMSRAVHRLFIIEVAQT
jgi:hypothetical protein